MGRHVTGRAYAFAFRVGVIGTLVLTLAAVLGPTLPGLVALAGWTYVVMFALPWLYVCYQREEFRIPPWVLRGPRD